MIELPLYRFVADLKKNSNSLIDCPISWYMIVPSKHITQKTPPDFGDEGQRFLFSVLILLKIEN